MKALTRIKTYELPVTIEPQKEGGYFVRADKWADCYAQGDTIEEAMLEITAVAQSLIELYQEEGLEIPLKKKREKAFTGNMFNLPIIVSA